MVASPRDKLATSADLLALPDHVRAEIIHGAIVERASPMAEHGRSQFSMSQVIGRRFHRKPGGRWPGGWWFGTEVDVEYERHEIFVHDVVGWRRDRVAEEPTGRPVRIRPDWVCEIVSPSNEKRDRVDKLTVLHRNRVPHYWIVDPHDRTVAIHRWSDAGYVIVLTAAAGDVVRAEPFDATELRVSALLGLEDDDE
jgi:Uma2 family endonuclease